MSELTSLPESNVGESLAQLRTTLNDVRFPLGISNQDEGRDALSDVVNQLDDYMLPRYAAIDAPLLAVFGGSTGAGKSTIINSLIGQRIASASPIRPTTRRPLLLHNPADARWFDDQRILPSLSRVTGENSFDSTLNSQSLPGEDINEVGLRSLSTVPSGLALLDSPDIDSVVVENRQLAGQLLAAADLWVFVTTAARYADAIPWAMLDDAANRNIVIAVVLNRVPAGVGAEVRADLIARLHERGLSQAPLFVISEQDTDDGLLADADISALRDWLEGIAHDQNARSSVVRQTLGGAVDALFAPLGAIHNTYRGQIEAKNALSWDVNDAFDRAHTAFAQQLQDGSLLRGEVLSRWQDVVGTGEWARKLETGISRLRDRITGFITARNVATDHVEVAIEEGLYSLLLSENEEAISRTLEAWERFGARDLVPADQFQTRQMRKDRAAQMVRQWQESLLTMIRDEGASKKTTARMLALGVNAIGVALIIVIFASTGGLVGGEVAVAGGTAVVAQRLLEAVFGDDAVRRMAKRAKESLLAAAHDFMSIDRAVFDNALAELGIELSIDQQLIEHIDDLQAARNKETA